MIAVDWGTSNFRAFRLNAEGTVVARSSSALGILSVKNGEFAGALRSQIGQWLAEGEQHVLLCGMVGSRQGWVEVPYLACPVGLAELVQAVAPVPFAGAVVRLVPGVTATDATNVPEVMRGEETAAMGLLRAGRGEGVACLPGTHAKWLQFQDSRIVSFTTSMTGELYSAISRCTILERTLRTANPTDNKAFLEGVARSAHAGGLLHHLFGVRTLTLMGKLSEDVSASYLSGLLIGHEVRAAMSPGAMVQSGRVQLAGEPHLCSLYAQAIAACGGSATLAHEDTAAFGLAAIGERMQWT